MAFEQQDLLDALHSALSMALSGVNIFNAVGPKDCKDPYAVVTVISDVPTVYFGTDNDDFRIYVQLDIYATREYGTKELRALGELAKSALHKQILSVTNAGNVSAFCTKRGLVRPENDNYNRCLAEYMILGAETGV